MRHPVRRPRRLEPANQLLKKSLKKHFLSKLSRDKDPKDLLGRIESSKREAAVLCQLQRDLKHLFGILEKSFVTPDEVARFARGAFSEEELVTFPRRGLNCLFIQSLAESIQKNLENLAGDLQLDFKQLVESPLVDIELWMPKIASVIKNVFREGSPIWTIPTSFPSCQMDLSAFFRDMGFEEERRINSQLTMVRQF
jgi:hypothetical protein